MYVLCGPRIAFAFPQFVQDRARRMVPKWSPAIATTPPRSRYGRSPLADLKGSAGGPRRQCHGSSMIDAPALRISTSSRWRRTLVLTNEAGNFAADLMRHRPPQSGCEAASGAWSGLRSLPPPPRDRPWQTGRRHPTHEQSHVPERAAGATPKPMTTTPGRTHKPSTAQRCTMPNTGR